MDGGSREKMIPPAAFPPGAFDASFAKSQGSQSGLEEQERVFTMGQMFPTQHDDAIGLGLAVPAGMGPSNYGPLDSQAGGGGIRIGPGKVDAVPRRQLGLGKHSATFTFGTLTSGTPRLAAASDLPDSIMEYGDAAPAPRAGRGGSDVGPGAYSPGGWSGSSGSYHPRVSFTSMGGSRTSLEEIPGAGQWGSRDGGAGASSRGGEGDWNLVGQKLDYLQRTRSGGQADFIDPAALRGHGGLAMSGSSGTDQWSGSDGRRQESSSDPWSGSEGRVSNSDPWAGAQEQDFLGSLFPMPGQGPSFRTNEDVGGGRAGMQRFPAAFQPQQGIPVQHPHAVAGAGGGGGGGDGGVPSRRQQRQQQRAANWRAKKQTNWQPGGSDESMLRTPSTENLQQQQQRARGMSFGEMDLGAAIMTEGGLSPGSGSSTLLGDGPMLREGRKFYSSEQIVPHASRGLASLSLESRPFIPSQGAAAGQMPAPEAAGGGGEAGVVSAPVYAGQPAARQARAFSEFGTVGGNDALWQRPSVAAERERVMSVLRAGTSTGMSDANAMGEELERLLLLEESLIEVAGAERPRRRQQRQQLRALKWRVNKLQDDAASKLEDSASEQSATTGSSAKEPLRRNRRPSNSEPDMVAARLSASSDGLQQGDIHHAHSLDESDARAARKVAMRSMLASESSQGSTVSIASQSSPRAADAGRKRVVFPSPFEEMPYSPGRGAIAGGSAPGPALDSEEIVSQLEQRLKLGDRAVLKAKEEAMKAKLTVDLLVMRSEGGEAVGPHEIMAAEAAHSAFLEGVRCKEMDRDSLRAQVVGIRRRHHRAKSDGVLHTIDSAGEDDEEEEY